MPRTRTRKALWVAAATLACVASRCASSEEFTVTATGKQALEYTSQITNIGPRPPGSAGIEKTRKWIEDETRRMGFTLQRDTFMATTPIGSIEMANLSYRIQGTKHETRQLLVAHYDSKRFVGFDFVGANDAASSVALLLALSSDIQSRKLSFDVDVVFVDGEEAISVWTDDDSLYGSRRLAGQLKGDKSIRAAIVLDMIGDADLQLINESRTDPALKAKFEQVLDELGLESLLDRNLSSVIDDHVPLIRAGIPTLHLMDYSYGGKETPGRFWHTREDTLDKLSAQSLSAVGEIVLRVLEKL